MSRRCEAQSVLEETPGAGIAPAPGFFAQKHGLCVPQHGTQYLVFVKMEIFCVNNSVFRPKNS